MRHELKALTIARFFAAILVVLFHEHSWPQWAQQFIGGGSVAVAFFFVLSGFVLTYSAQDMNTPVDRRNFYVRRIARIYPVYLLAWMLYGVFLVLSWVHDPILSASYMLKAGVTFGGLSALLMQAWVPHAAWVWNLPGWSLSVEAFFYVLFPLIFVGLQRQSTRTIAIALGVAYVSNLLCHAMMVNDAPLLPHTPFAATWGGYFEFFPPMHIFEFVFGVALGLLYTRHGDMKRPVLWLGVGLMLVCALITLHGQPTSLWNAWILAPFAAIVYALACLRPKGGVAEVGVLLGKASFAMYILQTPVKAFIGPVERLADFWSFAVLLVVFSLFVYQYFEKPIERLIKSKFVFPIPVPASAYSSQTSL